MRTNDNLMTEPQSVYDRRHDFPQYNITVRIK
jgi:hypothetical protein